MDFPTHANWTLKLIVKYVEPEWEHTYSIDGMSILLERLGLTYTWPTYTLKKADPEKQRTFTEDTFPDLKKLENEAIDDLLFEDESIIRDYQAIGRTWFKKEKQRIIPTYGQHKGVKLISILNYETGEVFCIEAETYDAVVLLEFLKKFLAHYPIGKIVMVLNNAPLHHAKLIQPFLEENRDRLELVFVAIQPAINFR